MANKLFEKNYSYSGYNDPRIFKFFFFFFAKYLEGKKMVMEMQTSSHNVTKQSNKLEPTRKKIK